MKTPKYYPIVLFLLTSWCGIAQTVPATIELVPPTAAQEATSIWRTIHDIAFFEKQGYTINLPEDPLIDSLIVKSKNGTFGNDDYAAIHTLVETHVFDPTHYDPALQKVQDQLPLIHTLVHDIASAQCDWDWDFKRFDTYKIVFTLYGTGGSYDPDEGKITLLTNKAGGFMQYQNPANTIIHEITHIGMEYSLVDKHQLPHGLKERVVDTFVSLLFSEKLPEYRIQDMGDPTLDSYLKKKADIGSLNSILSKL